MTLTEAWRVGAGAGIAETASMAGLSKVDEGLRTGASHALARSHPGMGFSMSEWSIKHPVAGGDGWRRMSWNWGGDRSGGCEVCQLCNGDISLPYCSKVGLIAPDHVVVEGVGVGVAASEKHSKLPNLVHGGVDGSCHRLRELHLMGQAGIVVSDIEDLRDTLSIGEIWVEVEG